MRCGNEHSGNNMKSRQPHISRSHVVFILIVSIIVDTKTVISVAQDDHQKSFLRQKLDDVAQNSHSRILSTSLTETISSPSKRCAERPFQSTVSMNKIKSWSDLRDLLENISPLTTEFVLPSFQVSKTSADWPITLNSSLHISCVSGGACIFMGDQDEGGGRFITIRGDGAQVKLQGLTFLNASKSAVVVAKKAGKATNTEEDTDGNSIAASEAVIPRDTLEQIICECHFFGYVHLICMCLCMMWPLFFA